MFISLEQEAHNSSPCVWWTEGGRGGGRGRIEAQLRPGKLTWRREPGARGDMEEGKGEAVDKRGDQSSP